MEGYVLGVFRVLALLIVWGIPAVLVMLVAVFTVLAPSLTLAGAAIRISETIHGGSGPREALLIKEIEAYLGRK